MYMLTADFCSPDSSANRLNAYTQIPTMFTKRREGPTYEVTNHKTGYGVSTV